jgi:putative peptidoglycan lipid II flippase
MKTPVIVGMGALAFGVILNFIFVPKLGLPALPLSTALSAWVNCLILYVLLHKRGHFSVTGPLASRFSRQLIAALAMGVALWFLQKALGPFMAGTSLNRIVGLGALVGVGGIVYFGLGWVIGAINKDDVMLLLRRKKKEAA